MNQEEGDREVDLVREGWREGEREGEVRGTEGFSKKQRKRER